MNNNTSTPTVFTRIIRICIYIAAILGLFAALSPDLKLSYAEVIVGVIGVAILRLQGFSWPTLSPDSIAIKSINPAPN